MGGKGTEGRGGENEELSDTEIPDDSDESELEGTETEDNVDQ